MPIPRSARVGTDRGGGVRNQLCRRDGAHRRLSRTRPSRHACVGYEVAGTVVGARRRGRGARRTASVCSPARSSAAMPRGLGARARLCRVARAAHLRAGRRDSRQLRDRVGGARRLRQLAARRARPRSTRPAGAWGSRPSSSRGASARGRSMAPPRPQSTSACASLARPRARLQAGGDQGSAAPFDVILDPIGGHSLRTSYNLLRPAGGSSPSALSAVVSGAKRKPCPPLAHRWRACRASPRSR